MNARHQHVGEEHVYVVGVQIRQGLVTVADGRHGTPKAAFEGGLHGGKHAVLVIGHKDRALRVVLLLMAVERTSQQTWNNAAERDHGAGFAIPRVGCGLPEGSHAFHAPFPRPLQV